MSDTAGLKVSGCQHQETSGSAIPFNPEQNCIQANADGQNNIDMLEDFGEINKRQYQNNPHVGDSLSRS